MVSTGENADGTSTSLLQSLCRLPENSLAVTAIQMLAAFGGVGGPRLVYLYGASGTGKTLLARSFESEFKTTMSGKEILFLSGHELIQQMHEALTEKLVEPWREELCRVDALVLEDLPVFERSSKSQELLLSLLDLLEDRGSLVLITSRKMPGDLATFLPRLKSRFRSGVLAGLEMPGLSSRKLLISHFADRLDQPITAASIEVLAEHVPGTPRELEAVFVQLRHYAKLQKSMIDESLIRNFLLKEREEFEPSLTQIASSVALQFGVSIKQMRTKSRDQQISIPRQTAMSLMRELTGQPLKTIASFFRLSNHTTVLHACKAVANRRLQSPSFDHEVHRLRQKIQGMPCQPR